MKTETKQKAVKKTEAKNQQPVKKEPDPYDVRTVSPAIPKCVVTGDPSDYPVEYCYEEEGGEHGTLENSL